MSRTRSRSVDPVFADCRVTWYDSSPVGGNNGAFNTDPVSISSSYEYITDVVTPRYQTRINNGEIITNPCVYVKNSTRNEGNGSATYDYHKPDGTYNYFAAYTGPLSRYFSASRVLVFPEYEDPSASIDTAKLNALAGVDKTNVSAGEDAIEWRQSLKTLRHPLEGIFDSIKRIKKTRSYLKSGLHLSDFLANSWLKYRFEFSPLIRSIHDIGQELASPRPNLSTDIRRSSGFGKFRQKADDFPSPVVEGSATFGFYTDILLEASYHAVILYRVKFPRYDLAWRFGWRAKDFPTTFWNVVPLSFMVDRVFNISNAITSVVNLADGNIEILSGSVTSRVLKEKGISYKYHSDTDWVDNVNPDRYVESSFTYDRQVWTPSLSDTIPVFKPMDLVKDLTSIADLSTLIYGSLRRK